MDQEKTLKELRDKFGTEVLDVLPFPKPHFKNIQSVKAIYLGCDPSNKHSQKLPYAFALASGISIFNNFIKDHENNLQQVGLTWDDVYVQNLCQNYFVKETSNNKGIWSKVAKWWISKLREELDEFDLSVPVLLTSAYLYNVLKIGKKFKPKDYYKTDRCIPIPISESELGRPLVPFYRNRRKVDYHLSNPRWEEYKGRIIACLSESQAVRQSILKKAME